MKKIRILYTIPNFNTAGSGKVVYDLVKGLDKTMFEPEICCFNNKGAFFNEVAALGVPIHIFHFATNLKPYYSLIFRVLKIRKFFKKHQFDIIHSWHWSSDVTEPLAARLAGIPWVYTKKAMSWGSPKLWKLRSRLASKIIVLNRDMIPRFFESMKRKVALIYLGVDTEVYVPQEKVYHTPLGHKFAKDDFVIVSVANLVPIKGIEYLIDAINLINDKHIKLLIVGNNNNEYGQSLIEQNKNDNIIFIDKQLDVKPYHAVSDVFVIPTKTSWEGLPVAPIEAMSSGRIVIGSNVEGVREVLASFNDFMFESKNKVEIAEKIKWMQSMKDNEREAYARKMRQTALDSFSLKACIENHAVFYNKVLNS